MPQRFGLDHLTKSLRRKKSDGTVSIVKDEAVYISLIKQLEQLLNIKDIYSEIHKSRISTPGVYNRYEDGSNFKNKTLFNDHTNALQIHLYLDEVQLCNLGSSYDQKFVFVYFSLANLDPKFRSTYDSINLLSVFKDDLVQKYTYNELFWPIVEELKLLFVARKYENTLFPMFPLLNTSVMCDI